MIPLAGGLMGGMVGQAADALGEPRRLLMEALGLPTQGSELMHQMFGVDPGGLAGQLGGFGMEVATDPLTYAGFLGGGLASAMRGGGRTADMIGDVGRLGMAAEAAESANAARGMGLASESAVRMGVPPASMPGIMEQLGPRTGVYGRDMARLGTKTGGGPAEAGSRVSRNVIDASQVPGGAGQTTRKARDAARSQAFDANRMANDQMLGGAMDAYDLPFEGDTFALPGMMLDPNSPMRNNVLARMNPQDAMQGISPLLEALQAKAAREAAMGPLDYAALGGTGLGALGGGIYAGMQ